MKSERTYRASTAIVAEILGRLSWEKSVEAIFFFCWFDEKDLIENQWEGFFGREMGSFKGHVLPGTLFLLVGVWHIWSAVVRFVSDPKSFRVRVWSPVPGFDGRLKYLELYLVVIGAFIDMCIELLYSTHLKFFVNGVLNPSHMNDFEHSGMLLMFFIFGTIALLSEKTRFFFPHFILLFLLSFNCI